MATLVSWAKGCGLRLVNFPREKILVEFAATWRDVFRHWGKRRTLVRHAAASIRGAR
jgi:hypothetical protein